MAFWRRKCNPYWVHTDEVARIVTNITKDSDVIASAHLHDVVEDTPVTINDIINKFGFRIGQIVSELTHVYTKESYPSWNRDKRKMAEVQRLSVISKEAKLIKIADIISNTADIIPYDLEFAKVYLKEKVQLLDVLKEGSPELWIIADKQVRDGLNLASPLN